MRGFWGVVMVLVLAVTFAVVPPASACGAFVSKRVLTEKELPYLAVERVLLAWDKTTGIEDFVRETRFDGGANEAFGFVVPTPSKPEVAAVKDAKLSALDKAYPYETLESAMYKLMNTAAGGAPKGGAPPKVTVLSNITSRWSSSSSRFATSRRTRRTRR